MRNIPTILGLIILLISGGYTIALFGLPLVVTWPAIFFGFLLLAVGLFLQKKKKDIIHLPLITEKQRNILRIMYLIFGFFSIIYLIAAIITFQKTLILLSYIVFIPIFIGGFLLIISSIVFFKHKNFIKIATIGSVLGIVGTIICFYGFEINLFTVSQTVSMLGFIAILSLNSIWGDSSG
ncbi:MAG: hypothetical protein JSW60_09740 [Thermoplasmatales archaeon]|nr:MAG: hypothetical protein JSW60_09740 [Thermoplasmatales archaeon]